MIGLEHWKKRLKVFKLCGISETVFSGPLNVHWDVSVGEGIRLFVLAQRENNYFDRFGEIGFHLRPTQELPHFAICITSNDPKPRLAVQNFPSKWWCSGFTRYRPQFRVVSLEILRETLVRHTGDFRKIENQDGAVETPTELEENSISCENARTLRGRRDAADWLIDVDRWTWPCTVIVRDVMKLSRAIYSTVQPITVDPSAERKKRKKILRGKIRESRPPTALIHVNSIWIGTVNDFFVTKQQNNSKTTFGNFSRRNLTK